MGAQVDDLVELLAGRQAVLVGHSYGGNVALATAEHHPDLVAGVAVYETPLSWEPWWPGTTAGSIAVAESSAARRCRAVHASAARRSRWEALPERTRELRRAEGVAMVEELADLRRHQPWIAKNITVPVVVAFGSRGADHHRRGMRHAADLLDCPLVELADCRHDAPLSHPALFRSEVIDPLLRRGRPTLVAVTPAYGALDAGTLMSEPRNVQVRSLVSPTAPRAFTLFGAVLQRARAASTPRTPTRR